MVTGLVMSIFLQLRLILIVSTFPGLSEPTHPGALCLIFPTGRHSARIDKCQFNRDARCEERREPMFQFALPRLLLRFTPERPALPRPLFRLRKGSHSRRPEDGRCFAHYAWPASWPTRLT